MQHSGSSQKQTVMLSSDQMKVPKREFDAILMKLIGTKPKPFTPKRKAQKRKAKPAAR